MEPGRLKSTSIRSREKAAPEYAIGRCETLTDTSLAELHTNLLHDQGVGRVSHPPALIAT